MQDSYRSSRWLASFIDLKQTYLWVHEMNNIFIDIINQWFIFFIFLFKFQQVCTTSVAVLNILMCASLNPQSMWTKIIHYLTKHWAWSAGLCCSRLAAQSCPVLWCRHLCPVWRRPPGSWGVRDQLNPVGLLRPGPAVASQKPHLGVVHFFSLRCICFPLWFKMCVVSGKQCQSYLLHNTTLCILRIASFMLVIRILEQFSSFTHSSHYLTFSHSLRPECSPAPEVSGVEMPVPPPAASVRNIYTVNWLG